MPRFRTSAKLSAMVFVVPEHNLMPQSWTSSTRSHASSKCTNQREFACKRTNLSRPAGHIQQAPSSSQQREGREIVAIKSRRAGLSRIWIFSTSRNASSTVGHIAVSIAEYSPDTLKLWKTIPFLQAVIMASKTISKWRGKESLQSTNTRPASQLKGFMVLSTNAISTSWRWWKCDMLFWVAALSLPFMMMFCCSWQRRAKYEYIVWYEICLLLVIQGSSLRSWTYSNGVYTHVWK